MRKLVNVFCIVFLMCVICVVLFLIANPKENENEINESDIESSNNSSKVNQEVYDELIKCSEQKEVKEKVLDIINCGGNYDIQEEIEFNGLIYKRIQLNTLEYQTGDDMIYNYYSQNDELKKRFDEELLEDNIVDFGPEREAFYQLTYIIGAPSIKKPSLGEHMVFKKGENFGFINKFAISALICYNKHGEVVDVLAFEGATGLDVMVENKQLKWEVFIVNQLDYYYKGNVLNDEPNRVYGEGFCSGTVYDIYMDKDNLIQEIYSVKESCDNNYYHLSPPYVDCAHAYKGVYVKDYSLSIETVIEWGMLDETKELLTKYGGYTKVMEELHPMIRERFGKETMGMPEESPLCLHYLTKEGYVVRIGPQTILRDEKEYNVLIGYFKADKDVYLEMENKQKYITENVQPLIIDGEVNPKLLKELGVE